MEFHAFTRFSSFWRMLVKTRGHAFCVEVMWLFDTWCDFREVAWPCSDVTFGGVMWLRAGARIFHGCHVDSPVDFPWNAHPFPSLAAAKTLCQVVCSTTPGRSSGAAWPKRCKCWTMRLGWAAAIDGGWGRSVIYIYTCMYEWMYVCITYIYIYMFIASRWLSDGLYMG